MNREILLSSILLLIAFIGISNASSPTLPSGIKAYVPIYITYNTLATYSTPLQIEFSFNALSYSNYITYNGNFANFEIFYQNSTIVPSQIQSETNNQIVIISKVSNTIFSPNSNTIYLGFASTTTNLLSSSGTTGIGEVPQLSSTYGLYDDGAKVYSFYYNFAGNTLNTSKCTLAETSDASLSINNGATFTSGTSDGPSYVYLLCTPTISYSVPIQIQAYVSSQKEASTGGINYDFAGFSSSNTSITGSTTGDDNFETYVGGSYFNGYGSEYQALYDNSDSYFAYQSIPQLAPFIFSSFFTNPNDYIESSVNTSVYSSTTAYTSKVYLLSGIASAGSGAGSPNSGTFTIQWLRTLYVPPNDQMPTATFGSLQTPAVLSVSISPSSATYDSGQTITLTANIINGIGTYNYQWYNYTTGNAIAISGATSNVFSEVAKSPQIVKYYVYINNSTANTISSIDSYTINNALSPTSITSPTNSITLDSGQSYTISVSPPTTGTSPYTYSWSVASGYNCPSFSNVGNVNSFTYTAPSVSSQTTCKFAVNVKDSATTPENFTLTTPTITINPALSVSLSPSTANYVIGSTITLTANAVGGTSPYSYQWYNFTSGNAIAIANATTSTFSTPANSIGTFKYFVSVKDNATTPETINSTIGTYNITSYVLLNIQSANTIYGTNDIISVSAQSPYNSNEVELEIGNTIVANGIGSINYNLLSNNHYLLGVGSYNVKGIDANTMETSSTETLTINPTEPNLMYVSKCNSYWYNGTPCFIKAEASTNLNNFGEGIPIELSINGNIITNTTLVSSSPVYLTAYTSANVGTYNVILTNLATQNFSATSNNFTFSIIKNGPIPIINITPNETYYGYRYGTRVNVTAGIKDYNNQLTANILLNGNVIATTNTIFNFSIMKIGNYTIDVETYGNNNYGYMSSFKFVDILKGIPTIKITKCSNFVYNGKGCNITAEINTYENQLSGNFLINGNYIGTTNSLISTLIRSAGNYTLEMTTNGNENYSNETTQVFFSIYKAKPQYNISIISNGISSEISENEIINTTIPFAINFAPTTYNNQLPFSIYLNGILLKNITSLYNFSVSSNPLFKYNITFKTNGNNNYTSANQIFTIYVLPKISVLNAKEVNVTYSQATYERNKSIGISATSLPTNLKNYIFMHYIPTPENKSQIITTISANEIPSLNFTLINSTIGESILNYSIKNAKAGTYVFKIYGENGTENYTEYKVIYVDRYAVSINNTTSENANTIRFGKTYEFVYNGIGKPSIPMGIFIGNYLIENTTANQTINMTINQYGDLEINGNIISNNLFNESNPQNEVKLRNETIYTEIYGNNNYTNAVSNILTFSILPPIFNASISTSILTTTPIPSNFFDNITASDGTNVDSIELLLNNKTLYSSNSPLIYNFANTLPQFSNAPFPLNNSGMKETIYAIDKSFNYTIPINVILYSPFIYLNGTNVGEINESNSITNNVGNFRIVIIDMPNGNLTNVSISGYVSLVDGNNVSFTSNTPIFNIIGTKGEKQLLNGKFSFTYEGKKYNDTFSNYEITIGKNASFVYPIFTAEPEILMYEILITIVVVISSLAGYILYLNHKAKHLANK